MYDNSDEIITEPPEKLQPPYEFKEEPVQLVYIENGMLETTTEAINLLTALKNEKISILSINGPLSSGKSYLANNIINKISKGFKAGENTKGIWAWGTPIALENGTKLLVLDFQGLEKEGRSVSHSGDQPAVEGNARMGVLGPVHQEIFGFGGGVK